MLSSHGNKIGSFNILEQYEHVQFAFDLSILNDWICVVFQKLVQIFNLDESKRKEQNQGF
jgi:hypothetical protein